MNMKMFFTGIAAAVVSAFIVSELKKRGLIFA